MSLITNSTILLQPSTPSPPFLHPHRTSIAAHSTQGRRRRRRCNPLRVSSYPQNSAATITDETNSDGDGDGDDSKLLTGASVVRAFYTAINTHDLHSVEDLIAHNCVYEDLIFPKPFVGRKVCKLFSVWVPGKLWRLL